MKLTPTQIAQIDETLVLNKVVYDDIKLELTDHIASDIEAIMTDTEIPFEVAFKEAFEKWKGQMKEDTFSFFPLVFFWKSRPKIIVDKWEKETKGQFLYSVLFSITIFILALLIMKLGNNSIINAVDVVCKKSFIAMLFILLTGRILMFVSKAKTTFGNLYNIYFFIYIFLVLNISDLLYHFRFSIKLDTDSPPFAIFIIVHASFSLRLLYKHFQFERKLKTV